MYPGLKNMTSALLQNAYAPAFDANVSANIIDQTLNPNNANSTSIVKRLCIDTFGPMLETTNFIVLEKSNPIKLYDVLPPADRSMLQNFDS
jgi:hypothetical protein